MLLCDVKCTLPVTVGSIRLQIGALADDWNGVLGLVALGSGLSQDYAHSQNGKKLERE